MATPVYLPKVGMTMEEGTVNRWLVADGEAVKAGQVLYEMETEKVQMEVEADAEGILKQLVPEGSVLKPGDVVACLLAPGEEVPRDLLDRVAAQLRGAPAAGSPPATAAASEAAPPASGQTPAARGPVRASPVARRLAEEHGIDLATIQGTGPDGRIVERDVQRAIEAKGAQAPPPAAGAAPSQPPSEAPAPIPYLGRRRTIGERMLQSATSMAQVTLSSEVAVDEALSMAHGLSREWRRDGVVVTLTGLAVRACALALREHPRLNANLDGDTIVIEPRVNVGVAVDSEHGLIVPVIQDADKRPLRDVLVALRELTEKARADRLNLEDVAGGTFTVSSLEGTGVDAFTPLVNPPQAAILGIGRVREAPGFDGPHVVRRQVTTLSLTFDHRITDGAPAARFLDRVAELLARPYLLM
ncbi:MAG TPA: dihydrolipoamide acetyltransferase family protein [Dehalococcoidia bacterium]|nr:dihydrolipoamide acetyltransferase family protein [Dehalococcoidia bacterium]